MYWGHTQPTWQQGFNTQVTLWDNLRLYARVDGNGGHWQSDTEIRALHNQGSTKAVIEQNGPFLQVYRSIETDVPGTYQAGFLRLRELSASYTLKPSLVSRIGASGGSVTLAGRNISMLWTAEQGWNTSRDGEIYVDVANQHDVGSGNRAWARCRAAFRRSCRRPRARCHLPSHLLIPDRGDYRIMSFRLTHRSTRLPVGRRIRRGARICVRASLSARATTLE